MNPQESHEIATELDRLGPKPVLIKINGKYYRVDGVGDECLINDWFIILHAGEPHANRQEN